MLRHSTLLRHAARLATILPFALLAVACGDDATDATTDSGTDASTTNDGAVRNDGSADGGADGADGSVVVTPDVNAPTVLAVSPLAAATDAASNDVITAEFSEGMAPATLTSPSTTFHVTTGTPATTVPGTVSYFDTTATFSPDADLLLGTSYKATITTAATDIAGNAMAAAYTWSFTTSATPAAGPKPVLLGAAGKYAMLAKSAISNVPTSKITGNVAISPAAASYITGFDLIRAGTKWTSTQIIGGVFSADSDPPTPSNLTTAISNMQTAYTEAAGRPGGIADLGAGSIGGLVLAPGLYKWSSSVLIPTDVVLAGAANDVWIFQITGDLKMSADQKIALQGGARPKNIFWQVAGFVELGTTSHAEGIMLSKTAITLATGASVNGRLLAQTAITLGKSTVTAP